ncbi:hypothetical protein LINGRAHAP2_LOCUS7233, partial [Linum grandiflorum]
LSRLISLPVPLPPAPPVAGGSLRFSIYIFSDPVVCVSLVWSFCLLLYGALLSPVGASFFSFLEPLLAWVQKERLFIEFVAGTII